MNLKSMGSVAALLAAFAGFSAAAKAGVLTISSDTVWSDLSALSGYDGVAIGQGATLTLDLAADAELTKPVSGDGNLAKAGTGTLTISAANTFAGGFSILGGTVHAKNDAAFGNADSGTTVGAGTKVIFAGITCAEAITGSGGAAEYTVSPGVTVLNGDVTLAKESKIYVEAGARCVFNAAYFGQHINISTAAADSEVEFNGKYSGYLWNSNPFKGRLIWNTEVRNDFGYTGNTIVGGIEYAFYNLDLKLGGKYWANPILDLNGFAQHVKTISPDSIHAAPDRDSQVTSSEKAFLHVADGTSGETLSRLKFTGRAGLCWEGPGAVALTNVMTSTGDLTVNGGSVRFLDRSVSSWENVGEVIVSGTGKLVLADEEQLGMPSMLVLKDEGSLTLPAGSTMVVLGLTVMGESKSAGTYGAETLSGRLIGEEAKIKVIGSNLLSVTENTVWGDDELESLVNLDGVNVAAGVTLSISNDVEFSLTVPIIGEGSFVKDGAGDLHLRSSNYFGGDFRIIGTGTVFVHDDRALGLVSGITEVYLHKVDLHGNADTYINEFHPDWGEQYYPGASLELCGVTVDETIKLVSQGAAGDLRASAGTENVINGELVLSGKEVGVLAEAGAVLKLRGGVSGNYTSMRPGTEDADSRIIVERIPFQKTAYLWNAKSGNANGWMRFDVPGLEDFSLGYTFQPIACGCDWAFNRATLNWDAGSVRIRLDLGGYNQRVKTVTANSAMNGYVTSSGESPAFLHVSDAVRQSSYIPFKGSAGFRLDVAADVTFAAVSDTVGAIEVLDGRLTLASTGSWPNCPKVTVAGDGVFAVEAAGAVSRKARVHVGDEGVVDIPSGVELTVGALVVDGVELPSGRYSDVEGSAKSHFRTGGGTLVVRGESLKMFVR